MDDVIARQVIRFTAERAPRKIENVSLGTSLLQDLGMDGDDAADFLKAFSEYFGVDLTRFDFARHFSAEGGISPLSMLFLRGFPMHVPITLADLAEAAESKVWIEK